MNNLHRLCTCGQCGGTFPTKDWSKHKCPNPMHQNTDWEKDFDEKFEGYWRGRAIPDELKFFIRSLLQAREECLKGEIGIAMVNAPEYPMEGPNAEMITWAAKQGYFDGLNRALALINKK